jgi:hypothetical protein
MNMKFKHPTNGYEETTDHPGLWCLLFGPAYFAFKGIWTQAAASLLLALFTGGLSWLIYPFFARNAVRKDYLRRGWIELDPPPPAQPVSVWDTAKMSRGIEPLRSSLSAFKGRPGSRAAFSFCATRRRRRAAR